MSENKRVPQHIAIIMDGNGRWAKQHNKERFEGHIQGVESVRTAIKQCDVFGVRYLTLYAFSTENWGRPTAEVTAIMELVCKCVAMETPELKAKGVRVRVIGDKARFAPEVRAALEDIENQTIEGDKLDLLLALNYSSRDEITRATRLLAERVAAGEIKAQDITEQSVASSLYTADVPDPDLIIRTSGECRLSNFLLWQASYSEFYFPDVLWPDFGKEEFARALDVYAERDRRYGLVK